MTEEMFGGQHRIDELTQAEQTVRVNTDETTGTVSNKYAHLRECMGVQKERKNQKKRLLTRPASLEMTHYCTFNFCSKAEHSRQRSRSLTRTGDLRRIGVGETKAKYSRSSPLALNSHGCQLTRYPSLQN